MNQAVADYIENVPPEHRPLFDRLHRLVLEACPDCSIGLSYDMPTYRAGGRRLHLGVWKHGVSIYGWKASGDGGFTERHPELRTRTGTIRIRDEDAAAVSDEEVRELARAVLTS